MKKCIVSVLAMFAIVLFATVSAQASSFDDSLVEISAQQPLPAFMQGLDATPMTNSEMSEVRGEFVFIPALYYYAAVFGVPYSIAYAASIARAGVPYVTIAWDATVMWYSQ